jgi:ParB/RepB/Spo0J family partition protein
MFVQNLSGLGTVGPAGKKPIDVRDIYPDIIEVGDRQRSLNPEKVRELARSMQEHGQKQPIGVRRKGKLESGYTLIYGLHRLEAIKLLVKEGDEHAHIWAVVYDVNYPEALMQMDEIIENLHRNDLTTAEKAAHQMAYAGLLKKAGKVQAADKKHTGRLKLGKANIIEPRGAVQLSENGQPTITEKVAADTGIDKDTVHRRHNTGQVLAARAGVTVPSLEKATADELIEGGKAALKAAQEKKDKAKESGKPEQKVDPIKPLKLTVKHADLDVLDLPASFVSWCQRRLTDGSLTIQVLEATRDAVNLLINTING